MSGIFERMARAAWSDFNANDRAGKLRAWDELDGELRARWVRMSRAAFRAAAYDDDMEEALVIASNKVRYDPVCIAEAWDYMIESLAPQTQGERRE